MERCTVMVSMHVCSVYIMPIFPRDIHVYLLVKVWLAKPSREEKAEVIASLLSGTTPAPTTTEEITSKLEWMRTCGSLLLQVRIRTSSTASTKYNKFMQECYNGSHNQRLHSESQQVVSLFQQKRSTQHQSLCQMRQ